MKILKKALLIFGMLVLFANNIYASTNNVDIETESSGFGKFILLLIAFGLVGLVLFLGYKMDKTEIAQKRKEKIIKNRNEKINDVYSEIYSFHSENNETGTKVKKSKKIEKEQEETDEISEENAVKIVEEKKNVNIEQIAENINQCNDEDIKNEIIEAKKDEIVEEPISTTDTVIISKPKIENTKTNDSTMLFNSNFVKNNDIAKENFFNSVASIKGYNYEEQDLELLELEQTIAEANIKRYTRKKENKPKENVKRYTRKKNIKINTEETKPRRGRPTKKEAEEKAKRGRPPKNKTEKAKRGRPPKNKIEKAKRGRPPKNKSTKKIKK